MSGEVRGIRRLLDEPGDDGAELSVRVRGPCGGVTSCLPRIIPDPAGEHLGWDGIGHVMVYIERLPISS